MPPMSLFGSNHAIEKHSHIPSESNGNSLFDDGGYSLHNDVPLFSVAKLRNWIICFVICDFNVDVGPEIEWVYPPTSFSQADLSTICFNSFPDRSISEGVGTDHSFHFRFRQQSPNVDVPGDRFASDGDQWYGYCLFRQQRDVAVKRNYGQKSFVIISQHDFPTLFRDHMLARTLTLVDFASSPVMIESACAQIASWPPPQIGQQELPFFGSIFDVHIPPHVASPLQGFMHSKDQPPNHPLEVYTSQPVGSWARLLTLMPSVADLYIVFERVLLSEPVVVLSSEPRSCSEFVSLSIDMIRPTPYAGDYRPYVTMHSDFFSHSSGGTPTRHFLIGITNPFILKRLSIPGNKKHNSLSSSSGGKPYVVYLSRVETRPPKRIHHHLTGQVQQDADYPAGLIDNEVKGYIARDWNFIKDLEASLRAPEVDEDEIDRKIRRHFAYQAALFLAPLHRYLATLRSGSVDGTKISEPTHFSEPEFLSSLSKHGSSLQFKGKTSFQRNKVAESFYKRFCRCPSLYGLLQMKMELANSEEGGHAGLPSPNGKDAGSAAASINESDYESDS